MAALMLRLTSCCLYSITKFSAASAALAGTAMGTSSIALPLAAAARGALGKTMKAIMQKCILSKNMQAALSPKMSLRSRNKAPRNLKYWSLLCLKQTGSAKRAHN